MPHGESPHSRRALLSVSDHAVGREFSISESKNILNKVSLETHRKKGCVLDGGQQSGDQRLGGSEPGTYAGTAVHHSLVQHRGDFTDPRDCKGQEPTIVSAP